ncbi:MAG: hypothetical protein ABIC18_00490 [Candidatus Omnitrophota bacterium]
MIILISGCASKEKEQLYSKDEAEKKFIQICKDEYNWDINTQSVGNTFWVYLPYQKNVFKFKASRFGQTNKCTVSYLDGNFSGDGFYFEYQISDLLKNEEDKGYTYGLIDELNEDFYRLLSTIYRVYFNAEQEPEFYVIIMADIINGMEISYIIYNQDLKKVYNNAIASEEYYKRILQEVTGNLAIINDKTGRYLNREEVILGEFLTKQIAQRIRMHFSGTSANSCTIPEEEIIKIIAYCLRTYEFKDFSQVTLKNLSSKREITQYRRELEAIKEF